MVGCVFHARFHACSAVAFLLEKRTELNELQLQLINELRLQNRSANAFPAVVVPVEHDKYQRKKSRADYTRRDTLHVFFSYPWE